MRAFNHFSAQTLDEASAMLQKEDAVIIAGGGDLLGALKDDISRSYPRLVVNIKTIPGLDKIEAENGVLRVGALATLADISRSELVLEKAPALAKAAGKCSAPNLRETTTIGGNICQLPRCWYFRKLNNRFDCSRKGGQRCFAISGENRFHSVFGVGSFENCDGQKRVCAAVNQAECAPVLVALNAVICTDKRRIPAGEFFAVGVMSSTVLARGEIVTGIEIPVDEARRECYERFAFRKSIDFPVINLSIAVDADKRYRICLGGVAPVPYEPQSAMALLEGKDITEELAAAAGEAACEGAKPYEANEYKLQLVKTLLKRALLAL